MKIVFDSEAELEQYICDKYHESGMLVIDKTMPDYLVRQMNLEPYGVADLVSFIYDQDPDGMTYCRVSVFELKKELITAGAFSQAYRYATAIKECFSEARPDIDFNVSINVVGTGIDDSCFMLNHIDADYYKVHFNPNCGVEFEFKGVGWTRPCSNIKSVSEIIGFAPEKNKIGENLE